MSHEFHQSPSNVSVAEGNIVRHTCSIESVPKANITWLKDGQPLANNKSAGTATAAGRLVVNSPIDQPAPPTGLKCRTLSATQVSLSWNQLVKPDFKAFSVHYFPTDGGDEGKDVALNDSFIVDKLQPHTNYTFYVRSYSGKSASEQSKRVVCKTSEADLQGGTDYLVRVIGATSLGWPELTDNQAPWLKISTPKEKTDTLPPLSSVQLYSVNSSSIELMDLRSDVDYVVKIRGESGTSHGPLSAESYVTLPPANSFSNGQIHLNANGPSDQFLGILVGVSISICCIALCTGSLLYRKKCAKPEAQVPSSLSENGQCSTQCRRASSGSMEMKGRRGERSSSHSTDEGDSLLSGPELEMDPEETTQITLLVDSSLVVVAPIKETAPDDGFYETHVPAQPQWEHDFIHA
ncbi:unnamed protein product [Nesidiocoris tenuis]|uniref:Fibronectin type-III domain-containing protein n=1 Tax=Nesidiocoris tenuis TaxID=355587 RepID=A0A6H5GRS4_9HEMI|nr:unnamed protein product [Nesidiocoris tenuis]